MPGGTSKYGLPYLLPSEPLYKIAEVTKLLAERLELLISNGTIGSGGGSAAPQLPGAAAYMPTAYTLAGYTTYKPTWQSEYTAYGATVESGGVRVPAKGIYMVTCQAPWEGAKNDEQLQLKVFANNVQIGAASSVGGAAEWETVACVATPVALDANTLISASAIHSDTANSVKFGGTIQGAVRTRLAAHMLYPTS